MRFSLRDLLIFTVLFGSTLALGKALLPYWGPEPISLEGWERERYDEGTYPEVVYFTDDVVYVDDYADERIDLKYSVEDEIPTWKLDTDADGFFDQKIERRDEHNFWSDIHDRVPEIHDPIPHLTVLPKVAIATVIFVGGIWAVLKFGFRGPQVK